MRARLENSKITQEVLLARIVHLEELHPLGQLPAQLILEMVVAVVLEMAVAVVLEMAVAVVLEAALVVLLSASLTQDVTWQLSQIAQSFLT